MQIKVIITYQMRVMKYFSKMFYYSNISSKFRIRAKIFTRSFIKNITLFFYMEVNGLQFLFKLQIAIGLMHLLRHSLSKSTYFIKHFTEITQNISPQNNVYLENNIYSQQIT